MLRNIINLFIFVVLVCSISCESEKKKNGSKQIDETEVIEETLYTPEALPGLSQKHRIKFKREKVLMRDMMISLNLTSEELCKELGDLNCFEDVHGLTLGGVDPYRSTIFITEDPFIGNTPIVVERISLQACSNRTKKDIGGETYFLKTKNIDDINGLKLSIVEMYKLILQRIPTEAEQAKFLELAVKVKASNVNDKLAQWSTLSCYTILTSLEFLFY